MLSLPVLSEVEGSKHRHRFLSSLNNFGRVLLTTAALLALPADFVAAASLDESLADPSMQGGVHGETAGGRLGPQGPARPASQLTARRRAASDDGRDVVERVLKHVVQDERGPLRRTQAFEKGVHCHADVVDECNPIRGIERVRV